jgi:F-BAR domain only protein
VFENWQKKKNLNSFKERRSSQNDNEHMKRSQSMSQQMADKAGDIMSLNHVFQQHPQSPIASNASTPTTAHPYAPLQSPTLSLTNNSTWEEFFNALNCCFIEWFSFSFSSNRYADLGDIFSEVGDISSTPASAASTSKLQRQIPTPNSSIAIPRPPSRRSEQIRAGRVSPATMARADSVGSLEFRTAGVGLGSRGPSPLTIGMSDTIPLAIAFHEIIHAFFK